MCIRDSLNTGDYVIAQFRLWLLPAIARLRRRILNTSTHFPSREPSDRNQGPSSHTSPTSNPPTFHTSNYPILDLTGTDSDIGWSERDALPSYQLLASSDTTNQPQLSSPPSTSSHTIPYHPDTDITHPPQLQDPTTISPSSSDPAQSTLSSSIPFSHLHQALLDNTTSSKLLLAAPVICKHVEAHRDHLTPTCLLYTSPSPRD